MKAPHNFTPPFIAHRGASALCPENTFAAFNKAKEIGLKWLEFDVMVCGSGEVIVIHDYDAKRTSNGFGKVSTLSYEYLKNLDAGSWFDSRFSQEKIPTLEEMLAWLNRENIAANVEIKINGSADEKVLHQIIQPLMNMNVPILLSSFSRPTLRFAAKYYPKIPLGFLLDKWDAYWELFADEINATSINTNFKILTESRAQKIKNTQRFLLAYTVDAPEICETLFAYGVDAVFTNCPTAFLSYYKLT